ncbi:hypothetical protein T484DRAFT_1780671, partial [Baffinella frigidus]
LYHAAKEKLAEKPKGKQFDFVEKEIFSKLDQFCKRAQKLIDMFTTIVQKLIDIFTTIVQVQTPYQG